MAVIFDDGLDPDDDNNNIGAIPIAIQEPTQTPISYDIGWIKSQIGEDEWLKLRLLFIDNIWLNLTAKGCTLLHRLHDPIKYSSAHF